jgi:thiol-disulfide isomerase/thioredoxin
MRKESNHRQIVYLVVAVIAIAVAQFGMLALAKAQSSKPTTAKPPAMNINAHSTASATSGLPIQGELPPLAGATAWINSQPLKAAELRGKVVLIEFWTYTCINWRRQFPYVRAWADKYKDKGLVVIGVHSPEFVFEKDVDIVRRLTKEIGVQFPVAVDSDHAIWQAFNNNYWPALYFVDPQGYIRHHQFGEGDYEQSELVIKQLLAEAGVSGIDDGLVSALGKGPEAPADWTDLKSPENYTGYEQAENFASPGRAVRDAPHAYAAPVHLSLNQWALSGNWTVRKDRVQSHAPGQLVYQFHARDLHLVMGPSDPAKPIRFRVLINGRTPGTAHGTDVTEQGYGTLTEPRMYDLIRQPKPIGDSSFTIDFLDPGAEAFCFTFG